MDFRVLTTQEEVTTTLDSLNKEPLVFLDLETTGLSPHTDRILDVQLAGPADGPVFMFGGELAPLLSTKLNLPTIVGHNVKFDLHFLSKIGVNLLDRPFEDTMLLGHLLDENRESGSLDSYIQRIWNDPYKEVFWERYKTYEEAPVSERADYACRDVWYTRALHEHLRNELRQDGIPDDLIGHVHSLALYLLKTEIKGIAVDLPYLTQKGVELKSRIEALLPQMRGCVEAEVELIELEKWAKEMDKRKTEKGKANVPRPEFSFDSSAQLMDLLYNKLELPEQISEKTKNLTADDDALEKLEGAHPVIPLVREYRGHNKVYGAYIEGTLERMVNGRIYPQFRVDGTKTGRLAHNNPNLAQLPSSGGVRGIYTPNEGCVFVSADYSQLEVAIEANLTGDKNLAKIFQEGLSKHDITSTELGIDRPTAKTLNFALQFWASHFKVAQLLRVPEKEALKIWNNYWKLYSGPKKMKAWSDDQVNRGEALVNLFGRKRRFEIRKRHAWDKDYRQAYNFLIQSTGSDFTSAAFSRISAWLEQTEAGRGMFTVHDEILIEAKADRAEEAQAKLLEFMVEVGTEKGLKIPLSAQASGPMCRWED